MVNRQMRQYAFLVFVFTLAPFVGAMETPSSVAAFFDDALRYCIIKAPQRPNSRLNPGPHSLTVGQFMERLTSNAVDWTQMPACQGVDASDDFWAHGFTEREKYLMALAAYYHDVGKLGSDQHDAALADGSVIFSGKRGHELIGFYYALAGILDDASLHTVEQRLHGVYGIDFSYLHEYLLLSGGRLKNLFAGLGLTPDEHRFVAVLIASHSIFIQLCANDPDFASVPENPRPVSPEDFITFLRDLRTMAGLSARVDEKFVSMVIALTIADSYAFFRTIDKFMPSPIVGSEYARFIAARREPMPEGQFFIGTKQWPGGESVFQAWYLAKLIALAPHYRALIIPLLNG